MRRRRVTVAVVMALTCTSVLTACESSPQASCPSWASFPTAQERYDEATAVVTTTAVVPSGTERVFQVDATVYDVTVGDAEKGSVRVGDTIRVISMPDACGGDAAYLESDPMSGAHALRLYLRNMDGQWATITPSDGVEPLEG
jgi:hypothetical protein